MQESLNGNEVDRLRFLNDKPFYISKLFTKFGVHCFVVNIRAFFNFQDDSMTDFNYFSEDEEVIRFKVLTFTKCTI